MTAANNVSVPRRLNWRVVVRSGGQGKLDPSRPSRPLSWHLTTCANPERVDAHCAEGRQLLAAGDDPEASRLAGINTDRVLLSAYVLAGATVGVAAWIVCGRVGGADPNAGLNYNLQSITAVVIGGTSLFGGRGEVKSALLGALIIASIANGMSLLGYSSATQYIVTGVILLAAVTLDTISRRRLAAAGR
jgi:ribose/xylose/arabinose/galactoside ABC-type transport system permease subunit